MKSAARIAELREAIEILGELLDDNGSEDHVQFRRQLAIQQMIEAQVELAGLLEGENDHE